MDANEYQRQAARTLISDSEAPTVPEADLLALKTFLILAQSVGALAELLKKQIFHQYPRNPHTIRLALHEVSTAVLQMDVCARHDFECVTAAEMPPLDSGQIRFIWNAVGLLGEAGELATLIERHTFGECGLPLSEFQKELGDVAWYHAALAGVAGMQLSDVLAANIAKLQARYPDGWNTADSQARKDLAGAAP